RPDKHDAGRERTVGRHLDVPHLVRLARELGNRAGLELQVEVRYDPRRLDHADRLAYRVGPAHGVPGPVTRVLSGQRAGQLMEYGRDDHDHSHEPWNSMP